MGSRLKEIHQQVFCMSIMFEMRAHYSELMRKKSLQEASYLLCDVYFHAHLVPHVIGQYMF